MRCHGELGILCSWAGLQGCQREAAPGTAPLQLPSAQVGSTPTWGGCGAQRSHRGVFISSKPVSIKALRIDLRRRKSNSRGFGEGFSPTNYHLNRSVGDPHPGEEEQTGSLLLSKLFLSLESEHLKSFDFFKSFPC